MSFSLNTTIIKSDNFEKVSNAIILLHGYGGDGKDISMLTINWKRFLKNSIFLCPDGYQPCEVNPNGYQWFDLSKEDPEYILKESLVAEKKLNQFIAEIKKEYDLKNSQICLLGFSQGCMMVINLGLTSEESYNCIVGFSGKIINKNNLSGRMKSKTKTLLIHGDQDTIVPPSNLLESKDFLIRQKVEVTTKLLNNCDHHIPVEASSLALNFIKHNLNQ